MNCFFCWRKVLSWNDWYVIGFSFRHYYSFQNIRILSQRFIRIVCHRYANYLRSYYLPQFAPRNPHNFFHQQNFFALRLISSKFATKNCSSYVHILAAAGAVPVRCNQPDPF